MSTPIKPCPWPDCGDTHSEPPVVRGGQIMNGEYGRAVTCQCCGLRGPVVMNDSHMDVRAQDGIAIDLWNALPRDNEPGASLIEPEPELAREDLKIREAVSVEPEPQSAREWIDAMNAVKAQCESELLEAFCAGQANASEDGAPGFLEWIRQRRAEAEEDDCPDFLEKVYQKVKGDDLDGLDEQMLDKKKLDAFAAGRHHGIHDSTRHFAEWLKQRRAAAGGE